MFAKVYAQILDSSLANDYQVRHVFEDFLKLCDLQGVVDMTPESISRRTNVPLDIVRNAIVELEKPDPTSRSRDCDGRRIVRLDDHRDWGWRIVNFRKYFESSSKEMLRMVEAERKRAYRKRFSGGSSVPSSPTPLSPSEGERERGMSEDMSRTVPDMSGTPRGIPLPLNTQEFVSAWNEWMEWRRKKKTCRDFEGLFSRQLDWLSGFQVSEACEILRTSMRNDWQGLFPPKGKSERRDADRNAGTANESWGDQYNSAAALKSQQKTSSLPGFPDVQ